MQQTEKPLEILTASTLLHEFRQDIRALDAKMDARISDLNRKIDDRVGDLNRKIDTNFKWVVGILLMGLVIPFVRLFF